MPNNILVTMISGIGDHIYAMAIPAALKQAYPDAKIIILTNCERFEFSRDVLEQFQNAYLARLGIYIERKKGSPGYTMYYHSCDPCGVS